MDKKWWTLIAVCVGIFMLLLDVTVVIVALPKIQTELSANLGDLQWVIDAYSLSLSALLLTSGSLADIFGRRRLFAIGVVVFTLGSLLCAVAQDPLMLILSRAGQGVGGAIMFATSLALLAAAFHGKERGTAFGIWGAVTGVAVAVGPVVGGLLTSGISWRAIFFVNIPIGVAALFITLYKVEESRQPNASRPDWLGLSFFTCSLIGLVYGLIRAGEIAWSNWGSEVSLAAGVVLMIAFVVTEARVEHPMFDLKLLRIPTFLGGSLSALAMNGSLFAVLLYLVLYLQDVQNYSALQTGLRLLVLSAGTMATSTAAGRLSSHVPVRFLIGPGLVLVALGLFLMSGVSATTDWTHLIPGFFIAGAGSGMVNPPLASTAVGVVHPSRSGMASGINNTFRQFGLAMSIAALGSIFTAKLNDALHHGLAGVPGAAAHVGAISTQVRGGDIGSALALVPPGERGAVLRAAGSGFATGLNDLLVITGFIALVGAVAAFTLIRRRDFVMSGGPTAEQAAPAQASEDDGRPSPEQSGRPSPSPVS